MGPDWDFRDTPPSGIEPGDVRRTAARLAAERNVPEVEIPLLYVLRGGFSYSAIKADILAQPCVATEIQRAVGCERERNTAEMRKLVNQLTRREASDTAVHRIKCYREATGCSLQTAKDRMNELYPEDPWPSR